MKDMKRRQMLVNRAVKATLEGATFVASTATPDRYDDVVDQGTWVLDNYKTNPVIQRDHDYCIDATIGKATRVEVVNGQLEIDVAWGKDADSQKAAQKVADGILSAVSVGFMPGRATQRSLLPQNDPAYSDGYGYVYYDNELLEVSLVAIPANPEALAQRSAQGLASVNLDELATKVLERIIAAKTLSQPQTPTTPQPETIEEWFSRGQ